LGISRIDIRRRIIFRIPQPADIENGTNFNRPLFRGWQPAGNREGFVKILNVDDVIAAELFGRLGKRAVGNQALSVADAQAGCGGNLR
jgi:hypothetical protein